MADKAAIGVTEEPYEMLVERGKIREFARATNSRNPDYLDDPHAVSPPTFLTTSQFWSPPDSAAFRAAKIDMKRLLHGEQEYVFHGAPPKAGTKLTVQSRIEDIFEKVGKRGGTMTFIISVQEFRDETGRLVAEARSTAIETGRAPTEES